MSKGDNTGGRPKKYTDVKVFQSKIDEFFDLCDSKNEIYTMTGLAMHLGMSRENLVYRLDQQYDENSEFFHAVKRAREKVVKRIEKELTNRSVGNVAGLIFWLKNNAGWRDLMEFEHSGPGGQPLEMGSLEIAARVLTILELARRRKEEVAGHEQKQIPEHCGNHVDDNKEP